MRVSGWRPDVFFHGVVSCAVLLLLLLGGPSSTAQMSAVGDGGPGPVKAQHLTVELQTTASAVRPGASVAGGLVIALELGWHVYWINAGDAGQPPEITWTMPTGVTASALQFPIPMRLPLGPLMDFGYENSVTLPFHVDVAKGVRAGPAHLGAMVTWVVCREVCVPGRARMGLDLRVDPGAPDAARPTAGELAAAQHLLPKPLPPGATVTVNGGARNFVVTLVTGGKPDDAELYPYDSDLIANAPDQDMDEVPGGVRVWVPRSPELKSLPKELHALIRLSDVEAYEFTAPVVKGEVPEPASALPKAAGNVGATTSTARAAIGLAFLGGILLNLMPCVFPVLFLKGLALVQSSNEQRVTLRAHGLVYTAGIVASFWLVVAVLLVLRSGTNQIGWGFQLQSPAFVATLAIGIFFFAMSLAGQFELGLTLTSAGGSLAQKQGYAGSFFTGVLAVVVATPCTAPLMGAAIGFALAQPAGITFAVFTALALGLALPYLLLTLQPQWTRLLPKPGAWMETLKQLTAVPLFATVIWLVWVFGRLYASDMGVDRAAWMLTGLLLTAIAGYAMRRWQGQATGVSVAVVLLLLALWAPLHGGRAEAEEHAAWQPWTVGAVAEAQAKGMPVFVDFTAAWCLSCQVNERAVLNADEVQRRFRAGHVVLLKADWTRYDAGITAALGAVGRSGVPTYVLYPAKAGGAPDVLPELLSRGVVLGALERDLKAGS